jgi:glyoxylase-like metal-dependent hydrolase (beta-lactamase superfamily II)
VVAPTALTAPGIEGAVMRAVSRCRGPVLDVLRTIFGNSPLVVISDDGSTLTFGVSSPGHTSSHVITYVDNDGSGSLTCGDTVTSVS